MKLTKGAVAALATGKDDQVFWDDETPGFGVRIRGLKKSWLIQYRAGRQQRRESLGDVRRVALDDARKIARQRFAEIELGRDPAADREKARALAARAALTLGAVSERYLDARRGVVRASTHCENTRYFAVQWAALRDDPVASITRADVAAQLQIITKKHGRASARRARATLAALYQWSIGEGLVEANPVSHTNDPAAGIRPRSRVLTDAELRAVWHAAGDDDFGRIIRLLILTGARRREIGLMRWRDVDFDSGVLTIPAEVAKNHHALELPLQLVALETLRAVPRRGEYVFGARGTGFTSWSAATAALRKRLGKGFPTDWSLHDLRRSARTGWGRIGVPPHIAELLINHVKGGVEAVYDKYTYVGEKRTALARWAEHVLAVVEGRPSNVVPLHA